MIFNRSTLIGLEHNSVYNALINLDLLELMKKNVPIEVFPSVANKDVHTHIANSL